MVSPEHVTIPPLPPDELYKRFNTIIAAGVFPDRTDPATVYGWANYAMSVSGTPALKVCATTSITSGGVHNPDRSGNRLDQVAGIQGNINYSDRLLQAALHDNPDAVSAQTTLNPAMMGKLHRTSRPHWSPLAQKGETWSQQDYLRVCFSHILGLQARDMEGSFDVEAQGFYTKVCMTSLYAAHAGLTESAGIDEVMNDKSLPESERSNAYLQFSTSFFDSANTMAKAGFIEMQPIKYIIKLIGARPGAPRSLGVGAELALGNAAGVIPLELALTGDQWDLTQLGDVYADLQERKAPFAAPAGKLALALSSYEPSVPSERLDTQPARAALTDPITFAVRLFHQSVPYPEGNPPELRAVIANYVTELEFVGGKGRRIFNPSVVKMLLHDEYPPAPRSTEEN